MQAQIYDKSYTADAGLVALAAQFAAVVAGAEDGGVAAPGGQNAAGFMGFAQTVPTAAGGAVAVRKLGISRAIGYGTINFGDAVAIYSGNGDVYSVQAAIEAAPGTAAAINVIGTAGNITTVNGDPVEIFVNPYVVNVAVS